MLTPHFSSTALLRVLTIPCTVLMALSITPLLLLQNVGLCSIAILPLPLTALSLPRASTNATNAGSLSLLTVMLPWAHPISFIHAFTLLASHSPLDFLGATVDIVALDPLSLATKTANVLPPVSSPINIKSRCTSGISGPSPFVRLHGSSVPWPLTQCLHQLLKGKWVTLCS